MRELVLARAAFLSLDPPRRTRIATTPYLRRASWRREKISGDMAISATRRRGSFVPLRAYRLRQGFGSQLARPTLA
jgi:hypothetical protein